MLACRHQTYHDSVPFAVVSFLKGGQVLQITSDKLTQIGSENSEFFTGHLYRKIHIFEYKARLKLPSPSVLLVSFVRDLNIDECHMDPVEYLE